MGKNLFGVSVIDFQKQNNIDLIRVLKNEIIELQLKSELFKPILNNSKGLSEDYYKLIIKNKNEDINEFIEFCKMFENQNNFIEDAINTINSLISKYDNLIKFIDEVNIFIEKEEIQSQFSKL